MKEIVFVTSNKGKIASAQQYFEDANIKLNPYDYELIEPRSEDIKEITKAKVLQAYEVAKKPCIALDSGLYIDALNGFPSSFVNFSIKTLGIEGVLRAMQGIEDRNCSFKECLAYYDGNEIKYFFHEYKGWLANEIRGKGNLGQWGRLLAYIYRRI